MRRLAVWVGTGFGIGYLPVAPATWASFAAMLLLIPFATRPDNFGLGVGIAVLVPVSIWASGEAERTLGHDARPIVIDEVVGMLTTVWGVSLGSRPILALGLAFLLFRLFDIWKPFPINESQRLPGGWGVVVDDLLAGVAANVVLRIGVGWVSP